MYIVAFGRTKTALGLSKALVALLPAETKPAILVPELPPTDPEARDERCRWHRGEKRNTGRESYDAIVAEISDVEVLAGVDEHVVGVVQSIHSSTVAAGDTGDGAERRTPNGSRADLIDHLC